MLYCCRRLCGVANKVSVCFLSSAFVPSHCLWLAPWGNIRSVSLLQLPPSPSPPSSSSISTLIGLSLSLSTRRPACTTPSCASQQPWRRSRTWKPSPTRRRCWARALRWLRITSARRTRWVAHPFIRAFAAALPALLACAYRVPAQGPQPCASWLVVWSAREVHMLVCPRMKKPL